MMPSSSVIDRLIETGDDGADDETDEMEKRRLDAGEMHGELNGDIPDADEMEKLRDGAIEEPHENGEFNEAKDVGEETLNRRAELFGVGMNVAWPWGLLASSSILLFISIACRVFSSISQIPPCAR